MIISILQPCFIPWMGYFEQMDVADLFIYMDDVQYTKKDWRNTNKLLSPYGPKRISIPIKKCPRETLLKDALISQSCDWRSPISSKVKDWYQKAPFYQDAFKILQESFSRDYENLVDLNYFLNKKICHYLGINTPIRYSSEVPRNTEDKNERIIEIVKFFEGELLYDGKSARNFLNLDKFKENHIKVVFQDYIHTPYPQFNSINFVPHMSILDLIMNLGKDSLPHIRLSPLSLGN